MTLLVLVRHGETAWNAERRLQGREDVALSARGRAQVWALAPLVARFAPTAVTTSPLRRARETAALLGVGGAHGAGQDGGIAVDERWQEADLGAWTGRTRAELVAAGDGAYAAWRAGTHVPPGAEPFAEMAERVTAAVEQLAGRGGVQLVVTHGGPVRAACAELVGLAPAALVPVSPGSATVFDLSGPRPRLRAFNATGDVEPATGGTESGDAPD